MSEPTFAALLAQAMRAADCTQRQLAERAGITKSFVSRLLSDDRAPRAGIVKQLADGLGLPPGDPGRDALLLAAGYKPESGPPRIAWLSLFAADDAFRDADPETQAWMDDGLRWVLAGARARKQRSRVVALRSAERQEQLA